MFKIVAFTGKRGHGKTTAAQALELGQKYAHLNFADPLRQIAKIAYGLTDFELNDPVAKETCLTRWPSRTPREIMQQIGTDMFRAYIPDTWTSNWVMRAVRAQSKAGLGELEVFSGVTCSDLRFLNEEEKIRSVGGIIIRVIDPRKETDDSASQHASETEMDQIIADHVIINDGSIEELQAKVLAIVLGDQY